MITRKRFLTFLTTAVMALALLATGSYVSAKKGGNGGNGNGGGGGEDPPPADLPPVRYQVQFFDLPYQDSFLQIRGTNNFGQAVGRIYHTVDGTNTQSAFLYDPQRNPTSAIDLNTVVEGIPTEAGWKLRNATAINSSGDIAVYLELVGAPTETYQAAMIDMSVDPPQLHIIPDAHLSSDQSVFGDMNDDGDIIARFKREDGTFGVYIYNFGLYGADLKIDPPIDLGHTVQGWPYINNNGQIAGKLANGIIFRDTLGLGGAPETFPPVLDESTGNITELIWVYDINDAGEFCGSAFISYPKKIKGSNGEDRSFVQGNSLETFTMDSTNAFRLNESSDFITWDGQLYHRSYIEGGGALLVSDLLDPTDPTDPDTDSDAVIWAESVSSYTLGGISIRDETTDFPELFGEAYFIDGSTAGFVLSPVPYQQ